MTRKEKHLGFTLVEMAVVLVIIGLVILTIFPALNAMRSANERALTQSNLHSLMLATATFVQANGCLPCPASPYAVNANFGKLGGTGTACGNCPLASAQGIVPFASLGIPESTAHDGWGHWITMRVDPILAVLPTNPLGTTFVPPASICTSADFTNNATFCAVPNQAPLGTNSPVNISSKGLCRYNLSHASGALPITVSIPAGGTQQAAVIFISHGTTGYGSYIDAPVNISGQNGIIIQFPSNLTIQSGYPKCSPPYGGFAQCNSAGNNSAQFYDAPTIISANDNYDDILAYADRNTLITMLGNPGCATTW